MTTTNKIATLDHLLLSSVSGGDYGNVPGAKAVAEATKLANKEGVTITIRNAVSDKVLSTVKPTNAQSARTITATGPPPSGP